MSSLFRGACSPTAYLHRRPVARLALALGDGMAWAFGLFIATWVRYAFEEVQFHGPRLAAAIGIAIGLQWLVGTIECAYRGRYALGSTDEAISLTKIFFIVGLMVLVFDLALGLTLVPRSVPLTAALLALGVSAGSRVGLRRFRERADRPDEATAQRVIILGAGTSGQQLVHSMLSDPAGGYLPVALLDDDPRRARLRVSGVPVLGTRKDVRKVAEKRGATLLVIAVRKAEAADLRDVAELGTAAGLTVKALPSLGELFRPWVGFSDLRDLDIADLLGRRQIDTDIASIAGFLTGRRVLVTGAGGSIGSELCRQIHKFGPAELMMLDRDESALHAVQLSIHGRALLDTSDTILSDIRDAETIKTIFEHRRPHVVFHAAALKHLPMLEQYPEEAWKTNVVGTINVLDAARTSRVDTFINISTDKAADPTSVLGSSKRIGERLVAAAASGRGTFVSVRFGNVLGSRGSVLKTFADQVTNGGPVTVTDPDVTRFFMTIPEAVQLVVQAAAIGARGEVLVLDMGDPVRIVDVARQMMNIAGRAVPITYTGLRPGEKLHETLFGEDEEPDRRPHHPAISHVNVPSLPAEEVLAAAQAAGPEKALWDLSRGGRSVAIQPAIGCITAGAVAQ